MALDRSQIIKIYTHRIVNSLVPIEFGDAYIQSITNDLINYLNASSSDNHYEINQITSHFKAYFLSNNLRENWYKFENILEILSRGKSLDQITKYLAFLSHINEHTNQAVREDSRLSNRSYTPKQNQTLLSSPYQDATRINPATTLDQLVKPFYETNPEESILTYLSYTLLGLDSKILSFRTTEEIELPSTLNTSYSGLLRDTLEVALLYKNLKLFIENNKGRLESSIKTAYLSVLESQLNLYVNHINKIFNIQPSSLISVYKEVFEWIFKLRLLYHLVKHFKLNGYEFLSRVFELTKFGDTRIKLLAGEIFEELTIPYYEILEHWIISGSLVDGADEFFIKFNTNERQFNKIIEYLPSRIPFFISKELGYTIFQIGKMIIFLQNYCQDLEWMNNYNSKFSRIILQLNNGLKSMSINEIIKVVNYQYRLLINRFTLIIQGQNEFYIHLMNLKKFLLMKSNDFIDAIVFKGMYLFNESSSNVSSNYLSKILNEAISTSSAIHSRYSERIDARVLDPTHGFIGWEVFTLEYRTEDIPINHVLDTSMIQYLKMFNFFWRLRHFQYLLDSNFVESCNLQRGEFKIIKSKYVKLNKGRMGYKERRIAWIVKSYNTINIIRNQMTKLISTLVRYLSFDIIENNFQKMITMKLFKSNLGSEEILLTLNNDFLKSIRKNIDGFENEIIKHNMNELTFEELIQLHTNYLNSITNARILSDSAIGKLTGENYITQIYSILETIFKYIKSTEQYFSLIVRYILILNIEENLSNAEENDDDLEEIEDKLKSVTNKIYRDLFVGEFKYKCNNLANDFKNDILLKDLAWAF